mmetsp:Transcript_3104/g.12428  ORF Transcript_3104/g.12428 Transcript_3104/m.12428 type:complete len:230 (+) Transcript_3104:5369-6058(+)
MSLPVPMTPPPLPPSARGRNPRARRHASSPRSTTQMYATYHATSASASGVVTSPSATLATVTTIRPPYASASRTYGNASTSTTRASRLVLFFFRFAEASRLASSVPGETPPSSPNMASAFPTVATNRPEPTLSEMARRTSGVALSAMAAACVKMSGAAPPSARSVAPATSSESFNRFAMRSTAGAKNRSATPPIAANRIAAQRTNIGTLSQCGAAAKDAAADASCVPSQ